MLYEWSYSASKNDSIQIECFFSENTAYAISLFEYIGQFKENKYEMKIIRNEVLTLQICKLYKTCIRLMSDDVPRLGIGRGGVGRRKRSVMVQYLVTSATNSVVLGSI